MTTITVDAWFAFLGRAREILSYPAILPAARAEILLYSFNHVHNRLSYEAGCNQFLLCASLLRYVQEDDFAQLRASQSDFLAQEECIQDYDFAQGALEMLYATYSPIIPKTDVDTPIMTAAMDCILQIGEKEPDKGEEICKAIIGLVVFTMNYGYLFSPDQIESFDALLEKAKELCKTKGCDDGLCRKVEDAIATFRERRNNGGEAI